MTAIKATAITIINSVMAMLHPKKKIKLKM